MDDARRIKISRYLSRALRHRPDRFHLVPVSVKLPPDLWVITSDTQLSASIFLSISSSFVVVFQLRMVMD